MTFGDILLNILLIPVLAIAGILVLALIVIIAELLSSKWVLIVLGSSINGAFHDLDDIWDLSQLIR